MKKTLKDAFADAPVREEGICKTVAIAESALAESRFPMPRLEFLYMQFSFIQKRWWFIQAALLLSTVILLQQMDSTLGIRRCLGTAAPLFAVLILPELWKNRSNEATEIESTTLFTIRQIYAARLTMFAGMDVLLLSLFFLSAPSSITVMDLEVQFLLPFCVSCCICLHCLYSCRGGSEVLPLFLCFVWAGIWLLIILDDRVFNRISVLGWGVMQAASILFMGYCILNGQKNLQKQWEAKPIWN